MATKKRKRKVSRLGGSQDSHFVALSKALKAVERDITAASEAATCKAAFDNLLDAVYANGKAATSLAALGPSAARSDYWEPLYARVDRNAEAVTRKLRKKCRV